MKKEKCDNLILYHLPGRQLSVHSGGDSEAAAWWEGHTGGRAGGGQGWAGLARLTSGRLEGWN